MRSNQSDEIECLNKCLSLFLEFSLLFSKHIDRPLFFSLGSLSLNLQREFNRETLWVPCYFVSPAIHKFVEVLESEFKAFYLDDGTLGGTPEKVMGNLLLLEKAVGEINLLLNLRKCEVICEEKSRSSLLSSFPSVMCMHPSKVPLLGSAIGNSMDCIDTDIMSKISNLKTLGERLSCLHDALCLLRHAFSLPKVLYLLRTFPLMLLKKSC